MPLRRQSGATSHNNAGAFESFLEAWLVRQEHYLDELLSAEQHCHETLEDDLKELVSRVLSHYQQYYEEKSKAAERNVYRVFSPTWFTPFERTFLWIAGFKPGLAFRIVNDSVRDLTEEQSARLRRLAEETKAEERGLVDRLAMIQESVAAPPMLEVMRHRGRLVDGETAGVVEVMEAMRSAMEGVLGSADSLRTRTVERVMEILNPVQNVKFLTTATQLQIRIRTMGLQNEAQIEASNAW